MSDKKEAREQDLIDQIEGRLDFAYDLKRERLEEAQAVLLAQEGVYVRVALEVARGLRPNKTDADGGIPNWFDDRSVCNVMAVLAQTAASLITSNNPTWVVDPIGDDARKYQSARGVDKLLQFFYRSNRMDSVLDQVALRAVLFNQAGIYVDWDSEAGMGRMKDSAVGRDGWFVVQPVDLFNVHWEPGVGGIDNAHWCVFESTMHIEEARLYFDNPNIERSDDDADEDGTTHRQMRMVKDLDQGSGDYNENNDRVRVLRYWEKPGYAHPDGLEIVVAGDTVVSFTERLLLGEFPVYMMQFRPKPYRDHGCGLGADLLRLQEDFARTLDAMRARRDQEVRPPWLVPRGSLIRGGLSTKPGALNEFNPRTGAPQQLSLNPMSGVVSGLLDTEMQLMEYTAGISDVSRGETPTSNATGRLTAFLAELDTRKIAPAIRSMGTMLSDVGRRMVRLWQKYGGETITVSVMGDRHEAEVSEIQKQDLLWSDIYVDIQSLMPRTQTLRQETVLNLLQMGVIEKERALEVLEFGGFNEAMGLRSIEATNARAENERLADFSDSLEDDSFSPNEFEDHKAHIDEHIRWIRNERPGKLIFDRFKAHIDEHMKFLQPPLPPPGTEEMAAGGPPGVIPEAAAMPGGLPPEMMPMVEPGVDTGQEAALASQAGLQQ